MIAAVTAVLVGAYFIDKEIKEETRSNLKNVLETVLETTEETLNDWAKEHQQQVGIWAGSTEVKRQVMMLLALPRTKSSLLASPPQVNLRAALAGVMKRKNYQGFLIASPDALSIASNSDLRLGRRAVFSNQLGLWGRLNAGETVLSMPQPSDIPMRALNGNMVDEYPTMFVTAPIHDDQGRFIAVLAFEIDPAKQFTQILQKGRTGLSGETYAFDQHGKLISESRFDDHLREIGLIGADETGILRIEIRDPGSNLLVDDEPKIVREQQPLTVMARSALKDGSGFNMNGYRDYRGVTVIGAWYWNDEFHMGITTELDYAEAYGVYQTTRVALLLFVGLVIFLLLVSMVVYVTGRKRLTLSEERTRLIVDTAVDGIITADDAGTITTFNKAAEGIFENAGDDVIGKNIAVLAPEEVAEEHGEYLRKYRKTGKANILGIRREVVGLRGDGSTFPMDLSVSKFSFDGGTSFVGVVRDITERKKGEDALSSALFRLQRAQNELVESEKMASLGGLVAGVAHEINTPIGVSATAVSHLRESADQLNSKFLSGQIKKTDFESFLIGATESVRILESNLRRAADLVHSFKQVSMDQGNEETRTISLLDHIDDVLVSLHQRTRNTQIAIEVSGDRSIEITTIPGAISQVITNLILNSIIHAYDLEQAGKVRIHAETDGETVKLDYADDGKGMDDGVRAKVFEPFYTTNRGTGGAGLGMHIVFNRVTQVLQGKIECKSTLGKGTVFHMTFPLDPEHKKSALKDQSDPSNTAGGATV